MRGIKIDRKRSFTQLQNTELRRHIGYRCFFGLLLAVLLTLTVTMGQVYADVSEGPGTVQTEIVETSQEAETSQVKESDASKDSKKTQETGKVKETQKKTSAENEGKVKHSPLRFLPLFILLLIVILVILLLSLQSEPEEKLEKLFDEYNIIYEKQHRYYAYCVEQLLRLERLGAQQSLSKLENVRNDVGRIYNERIENARQVETIKENKTRPKDAVRSMKKILPTEQEHLRRLENHLRVLKDENAKYTSDSLSGEK